MTVADERIVLVGGISSEGHVRQTEIFDGSTWRDRAPIPTLRDHLGAATDGHRLVYAAGGRREGRHFATFEVYDVESDRWRGLPDMPTARSGLGSAFISPAFVITAGGEGPRIFPEVEMFDESRDRWMRLPDLAVPTHGVGIVTIGAKLYALVGGSRIGLGPARAAQVLAFG